MPKQKKMKQPPFAAKLTMAAAAATIDITGCIGIDTPATGFTDLVSQAKEAGCTELTLRINSMGGYCYDGLAMFDALKNCGMRTTGIVCGTAQSMASFLLQVCDHRVANEHATLMFHQPSCGAYGTVDELMELSRHLCEQRDTMFAIMGEKCGKSGEELSREHMTMKLYNAKQALEAGFIDEIAGAAPDDKPAEELPEPASARSGLMPYNAALLDFAMNGEVDEDEPENPEDDEPEDDDKKPTPTPEPAPKEEGGKKPTPAPEPEPSPEPDEDKDKDGGNKPENKGGIPDGYISREEAAKMVAEAKEKAKAEAIASMGVSPDNLPGMSSTDPAPAKKRPTMAELDAMPYLMRMKTLTENPDLAAEYAAGC